jgi:Bifunctional DNA primase/polymerase, N-terminal
MNITQIRLDLKAAGYSPIPLTGKIPVTAGWPTMDSDEQSIRTWPTRYPFARNTGVITRTAPAIDVDITNVEAAREVYYIAKDFFGERGHLIARIGKPPKFAILLRSKEPMKKTSLALRAPDGGDHQIEVLGDGQQMVAFGIHPDTRRPYLWRGGSPGPDVPLDSLPFLDEDLTAQFLKAVAAELPRKFEWRIRQGGVVNRKRTGQQWAELVRDGADVNLRHPRLLSLVGHLLNHYVDPRVVLELAQAWNLARCRPPKPEREVYELVNWCAGRELNGKTIQ